MNRPADMAVFVTAFFIFAALLIQTAYQYGYDEAQAKCKPLPKVEFKQMSHKQQVRSVKWMMRDQGWIK